MATQASGTWLVPEWPVPPCVQARVTTRWLAGHSAPPRERCNLGDRCGDDAVAVAANRDALIPQLQLPGRPRWLRQVHGRAVHVVDAAEGCESPAEADAAVTRVPACVLAVLTADCLPVLFAARSGDEVAVAHAGWRGLAGGVLEACLARMQNPPGQVVAWLGPAIGAASYEVGEEVRQAFVDHDAGADAAFRPTRPGHWLCDLAALARRRLAAAGLREVGGGGFDTFSDPRFYSYRRDARSGRFASLIWID